MMRWRALWAMARRNLRKSWMRQVVLVLALTLAITGDVLIGLFFAGLEARAGDLAPPAPQNVPLVVLAPDGTNVEAWLSWTRAIGVSGARGYEERHTIAWREGFTSAGRTFVLAVDFDIAQLRTLPVEGRWPFELDEVALPRHYADELEVGLGELVTLGLVSTVGSLPAVRDFRVTAIFRPEVALPGSRPGATWPPRPMDPALSFPLLALHPGGQEAPRWPANGAFVTVREGNAAFLERRMRSYFERDYQMQPAAQRFGTADPIFLWGDLGPELGRSLGRQIFSPGRRALAASFVFVGTGIFVILLIAFIERKRELAVLKTVGMNNNMVLGMVLLELGAVAFVALVLGSVLAGVVGQVVSEVVDYVPAPTLSAWFWATMHTGAVLVLATLLPVSMMRLATVQQLLQNERLYIWRKRVTLS